MSRAKILIPTLISILFLFYQYTQAAESQTNSFSENIRLKNEIIKGISLIYNAEYDKAEQLFSDLIKENPKNPAPYFYFAMVTWGRMAFGFWSPEVVKQYQARIDKAISIARYVIDLGKSDSFTYFYLGGALGFKGRLRLMEQRWFSSYIIALQAIDALKKCQDLDPDNRDVLLGLGMYDYYTAQFSGILKFITEIFLHKGDREKGLKELHIASNEAIYSNIEAESLLLYIYIYMENDYKKALPLAKELAEKFPFNPGHSYNIGITYILLGSDAEYRSELHNIQRRAVEERSAIKASIWERRSLYLEACYWLFKGQYDKARKRFSSIANETDSNNDPYMIAWPQLKIGMSYELEGDKSKAVEYYRRVIQLENGAGAQFLAKKYIDDPLEKSSPFLLF